MGALAMAAAVGETLSLDPIFMMKSPLRSWYRDGVAPQPFSSIMSRATTTTSVMTRNAVLGMSCIADPSIAPITPGSCNRRNQTLSRRCLPVGSLPNTRPSAPGLLAWLDTACVWQLQRRNGYHFELQPPEVAIPPEEDAVSIEVVMAYAIRLRGSRPRCAHYSMRWLIC